MSNGAHARVLVVEDEPTINQAVTDRLTAESFAVRQVYDGPAAVDAAPALASTPTRLPTRIVHVDRNHDDWLEWNLGRARAGG